MSAYATLVDELESVVGQGEIGRQANVLQRITDLFVTNSDRLSREQIELFGGVMSRLVEEVDVTVRAAFGERIAAMPLVPSGVVRELALDDAIEVAGPILRQCEQIGDEVLVETATTKSQNHLLAISQRRSIPESVTDVLVERGNQEVAVSTAGNAGAKFSEFGYSTLVRRAETDGNLAACVWRRPEIPRQHLLALFAAASQVVRQELQSIDPHRAQEIGTMIGRAGDELQERSREHSAQHEAARLEVELLRDAGILSEAEVFAFARDGKFDQTSVALSLLCDLPIGLVERAMVHDKCDQLLVLAKSIDLSFDTVKAIASIRAGGNDGVGPDIRQAAMSYGRLRPETARKVIRYYRLRERTGLD
jgi:uncharacterized protein (DUF2336 family)